MKRILMHFLYIVAFGALIGLLAPFFDNGTIPDDYLKIENWVLAYISVITVYPIIMYFTKINPRTFYYCIDKIVIRSITFSIALMIFILALAYISILVESIVKKIIILILVLTIFLFVIYALFHRGICIYKNKIRIFKFKIYTYNNCNIESISHAVINQDDFVIITICGKTHKFKISKLCLKRLKKLCEF